MAVFRATNYWRAMLRSRMRIIVGSGINSSSSSSSSSLSSSSRMYATAASGSTLPKMKPFAPTADHHHHHHANIHHQQQQQQQHSKPSKFAKIGEFIPIYVVMGLVMVALAFGAHTAKQQLRYAPSVHVSKKKRETMTEVEEPDHVLGEADKFINKSFFRKVAHIQDSAVPDHQNPDPIRGDIFTSPRKAHTLKSVGVNPSNN